jgi:hypothetical protein
LKPLFIGVDFDGTVVEHAWPEIGAPVPGALQVLRDLQAAGHRIILHTMRSGETLVAARQYLEDNGVELFGANENPTQKSWTSSPKPYCHVYIDDAALGCPLIPKLSARPFVDWHKVREELIRMRAL